MAKGAYIGINNFTQRILPSGYTQVEYIENTDKAYINTGFKPNQNTRVVLHCYNNATNTGWIYGCRDTSSSGLFGVLASGGFNYGSSTASLDMTAIGEKHIDQNKNVYTYNGTSGEITYQTFSCSYELYLFVCNASGSITSTRFLGRIYSCQIYDNGTLIRDYVPCINTSGAIGLYDLVNGQFYSNAGTGTFIAGDTYKSVARKIKKGYVGAERIDYRNLPSGYTQVEYIESSGTQYINTNFRPKYNSRVVMDISDVPNAANCIFGTRNSTSSTASLQFVFYRSNETRVRVDYFGSSKNATVADSTVRTIIDMQGNIANAYGVTVTATAVSSGECSYPLFLLAMNNVGKSNFYATAKVYSCKIYDGGFLVRDYVPCINLSGEVGLYDLVAGQFYANAGTGNFVAGDATQRIMGFARKIKKAYIGIGGVARPCFGGGELAYYGNVSNLLTPHYRGAATTVGDYAIFSGYDTHQEYDEDMGFYGTITAYNSSLTRKIPSTYIISIIDGAAAASNSTYALFGGGSDPVTYLGTDYVYAYNKSLTFTQTGRLSTRQQQHAATSIGDCILFGGGYSDSSNIINIINIYNSSLTKGSTTLSVARAYLAAASNSTYALFGGGGGSSVVDAYNTSLTRTIPTKLSAARGSMKATTAGDYILFGALSNQNVIDVYNTSLTRTTATPFSIARNEYAATSVGGYALFGGGYASNCVTTVDAYDASLTHTTPTPLRERKHFLSATTVGNYALFGGGSNGAYSLSSVDAYTIT